jgi:AcrR family transcriptional regulator
MLLSAVGIEERRARDRAVRRRLIVATARRLAEAEGWDAVTTRRLSTEIEYSQPVLYKHFSGMDAVAEAVAIDGFGELADVLSKARSGRRTPKAALKRIAHAYIEFAHQNPALYDAMFTRATTVRFADAGTPPQLSAAFAELRDAVSAIPGHHDADTLTEVAWSALHGLVTLTRGGRLRSGHDSARVELLIDTLCAAP